MIKITFPCCTLWACLNIVTFETNRVEVLKRKSPQTGKTSSMKNSFLSPFSVNGRPRLPPPGPVIDFTGTVTSTRWMGRPRGAESSLTHLRVPRTRRRAWYGADSGRCLLNE